MSMNISKQFTYLFILLALIGFSTWIYLHSQSTDNKTQHTENDFDFYAKGITYLQFDKTGKLKNTFSTPNLMHYPKDNASRFSNPNIVIFRDNEPPWTIIAKHGQAFHGNEKIILRDNVKLQQKAGSENPIRTITTSVLDFYPKTNFATTKAFIRFAQPGMIMTSNGMKAYLDEERILLSHARGNYHETKS